MLQNFRKSFDEMFHSVYHSFKCLNTQYDVIRVNRANLLHMGHAIFHIVVFVHEPFSISKKHT